MNRLVWICCVVCLLSLSLKSSGANELDAWVASHIGSDDRLLCKTEQNGERFFVALRGDKMRLGYALDMSQYKGTNSFIAGWSLRDEGGRVAVAQVPPVAIKDEFVITGGEAHAIGIQEQTLRPSVTGRISVTLNVKKCPSATCERQTTLDTAEVSYSVPVCTIVPQQ